MIMVDKRQISDPEDEMLVQQAPELFGVKHGGEFSVPDGYFDTLPSLIRSRLPVHHGSETGTRSFYHSARTRWIMGTSAVAAVVLVILLIVLPATRQTNMPPVATVTQPAAAVDYADYLDESSIVDVMLAGQVPDPFAIAESNRPRIMIGNTAFTRDEIVNYLVETDHNDQLIHDDLGQ
jgi:hypothetical protein